MEIRSSGRAHGNQHVWKPALPESGLPEELMEIRSSGNQVFRKSGLLEEIMEFSSSGRHDGNKIFQKSSWKSNLSEELMKISPSRRGNRNQLFWKY